ncbi:MAG: signal peptide peptidase SppA [Deltaproteobacteria bacterium]|nr:signal peptide peptidase SppA [Deltaproteobacteria bacterium]
MVGLIVLFFGGVTFFVARLIHPGNFTDNSKNGIGVVTLRGVILQAKEPIAQLTAFRNNANIKAVIVRIDSPGGAVGASQEIYAEIKRTARAKPVVASMESVAASGGYYAALGASKIVADPGTITGSIGVIIKFANLQKLFKKIGYQPEVIKSGSHKDIGSTAREMTKEERQLLQAVTDNIHEQFIRAVAGSRHLKIAQVKKIADGRVLTGEQALKLGLLDQLGNFTDAVQLAAKLAGIPSAQPNLVYPKDNSFNLLHYLTNIKDETLANMFLDKIPAIMYKLNITQ